MGCSNGVLDATGYSAPLPIIGLYIAAATLVCLAFMINDILVAFRTRKRWLPCHLFSLNSMTLTLLAVVAKLPIDLTSPMPSAPDQLAKLSSTAVICISMGFFMPSIGINKESDCLANMIALSIFLVTVIVNLSMQMYTGVIFLFITEHIIIICCMLGLLIMLWFLAWATNYQKRLFVDHQKDLIQKGEPSMLRRLKLCCLYGFNSNMQFVPCKDPHSATIGFLCILSLVVVMQAAFRSLIRKELKFCGGSSDYGWSMWMIVVTQIFTILVGTSATSFRWLAMATQMNGNQYQKLKREKRTYLNPILGIEARDIWKDIYQSLLQMGDYIMNFAFLIPATAVNKVVGTISAICITKYKESKAAAEFEDMNCGDMELDEWTFWKSVDEMTRWMAASKNESLNHLSKLLSRRPPSQQLYTLELRDQVYLEEGIEVSILSMVILVRIAIVSVPPILSGILAQTLNESFDTINFINDRINFVSTRNSETSKLANLVRKGRDFHVLLPIIFGRSSVATTKPPSDIDRALLIIRELKTALPSDVVWDEIGIVTDFINRRSYSSIKDLYNYIEQLLVDMLHLFFAQLPIAIYNEVTESPPEEYEERVRLSLRFLWKIEPLEALVQWSFPGGSNISSLITPEVPEIEIQTDNASAANDDDAEIRSI